MYKTNLANLILDYSNFLVFLFLLLLSPILFCSASYGSEGPSISSKNLVAEKVAGGLETPTGIAFIGQNDILAVEKNSGKVPKDTRGRCLARTLD